MTQFARSSILDAPQLQLHALGVVRYQLMSLGNFIIRLCDGGFAGIEAVRRWLGRLLAGVRRP